jgi:hypothetical protein
LINRFKQLSLKKNDEDDEWMKLFQEQREFRSKHQLTAGKLLDLLNLPINHLRQYLYSSKIKPSKRQGTLAYDLRSKLKEFFYSSDSKNFVAKEGDSEQNLLAEIENNYAEILQKSGISSLVLENNEILVITCIDTVESTINDLLNNIDHGFFSKYKIAIDKFTLCAFYGSPIGTKA